MKTCPGCSRRLSLSSFGSASWSKDGFNTRCRECCRLHQALWRKNNPDKARAYWRKHYAEHSELAIARTRQWRERNREKYLYGKSNCRLRKAYGITRAEYLALVARQNGLCAVCGNPPRRGSKKDMLHVDHDHATGRMRGLLCDLCNRGIGMLRDDFRIVSAAAKYLKAHGST